MPTVTSTIRDDRANQQYNLQLFQQAGQLAQTLGGIYKDYRQEKLAEARRQQDINMNVNTILFKESLSSGNISMARTALGNITGWDDAALDKVITPLENAKLHGKEEGQKIISEATDILNSKTKEEAINSSLLFNIKGQVDPDRKQFGVTIPMEAVLKGMDAKELRETTIKAQAQIKPVIDHLDQAYEARAKLYKNNPQMREELTFDYEIASSQIKAFRDSLPELIEKGQPLQIADEMNEQIELAMLATKKLDGAMSNKDIYRYSQIRGDAKTYEEYTAGIKQKGATLAKTKKETELATARISKLGEEKKDKQIQFKDIQARGASLASQRKDIVAYQEQLAEMKRNAGKKFGASEKEINTVKKNLADTEKRLAIEKKEIKNLWYEYLGQKGMKTDLDNLLKRSDEQIERMMHDEDPEIRNLATSLYPYLQYLR